MKNTIKKVLILNLFLIGFAQAACHFILVNDTEMPIFATTKDYGMQVAAHDLAHGTKILPGDQASIHVVYIYEFDDFEPTQFNWKKRFVVSRENKFTPCPSATKKLYYADFTRDVKIKGLKIIKMTSDF